MRAHKLKTWPKYFSQLRYLNKTCELRRADRDFLVGDYLMLLEYDPEQETATGAYELRRVTHILTAADPPRGLCDGFVVMSLAECDSTERDKLLGQYSGLLRESVEWVKPREAAMPA